MLLYGEKAEQNRWEKEHLLSQSEREVLEKEVEQAVKEREEQRNRMEELKVTAKRLDESWNLILLCHEYLKSDEMTAFGNFIDIAALMSNLCCFATLGLCKNCTVFRIIAPAGS